MNVISDQDLRRQAGLYTIRELVGMFGCSYRWFHYQIEMGRVARPSTRIGRKPRRYYTSFELETIRQQMNALK